MHRQRNAGPGGARGGAPAPWATRLATAFGVWAPGWAWASTVMVFCPIMEYEWAFAYVLLECAFSVAHFGACSHVALQNMYIPKLMENVSCKP